MFFFLFDSKSLVIYYWTIFALIDLFPLSLDFFLLFFVLFPLWLIFFLFECSFFLFVCYFFLLLLFLLFLVQTRPFYFLSRLEEFQRLEVDLDLIVGFLVFWNEYRNKEAAVLRVNSDFIILLIDIWATQCRRTFDISLWIIPSMNTVG